MRKRTRRLSGKRAGITLLDGSFPFPDNTDLVLHGVEVEIKSKNGHEKTTIDCRHPHDGSYNNLFLRGESDAVTVSGFTLRKCLVDEQVQVALASHPQYAAHVAGAARWPSARAGVTFRRNLWVSD